MSLEQIQIFKPCNSRDTEKAILGLMQMLFSGYKILLIGTLCYAMLRGTCIQTLAMTYLYILNSSMFQSPTYLNLVLL